MVQSLLDEKFASWIRLGHELTKRSLNPLGHFSFVSYFIVAVVIFGGAGIWVELRSYIYFVATAEQPHGSLAAIRAALVTFFPALAGSSCMQLIWAENHERSLRAFAVLVFSVLVVAIFFITPVNVSDSSAIVGATVASFLALWSWWIANANQRDLLDLDAPTGGKATGRQLPGNLDNFKV